MGVLTVRDASDQINTVIRSVARDAQLRCATVLSKAIGPLQGKSVAMALSETLGDGARGNGGRRSLIMWFYGLRRVGSLLTQTSHSGCASNTLLSLSDFCVASHGSRPC